MSKSSAFAAIAALIAVLATAVPAFADPQPLAQLEHQHYSNRYADLPSGYAEQRYVQAHAHYLTSTGSTEQAPARSVRYLTYGGNTEQVQVSHGPTAAVRTKSQPIRGQALNELAPAGVAAEMRGVALNAEYGNAWTKMSSAQFSALVGFFGNDITQYSPTQLKTFVLHGEKGTTLSAPRGNGFDFRDFAIGIAAAIAAMLAVGVVRRGRRTPTLEGAHGAA